MKAVEFEGTVSPNGQIAVPAEIAGQLPPGEPLHERRPKTLLP